MRGLKPKKIIYKIIQVIMVALAMAIAIVNYNSILAPIRLELTPAESLTL